jgi:hypothetical protein
MEVTPHNMIGFKFFACYAGGGCDAWAPPDA